MRVLGISFLLVCLSAFSGYMGYTLGYGAARPANLNYQLELMDDPVVFVVGMSKEGQIKDWMRRHDVKWVYMIRGQDVVAKHYVDPVAAKDMVEKMTALLEGK